ncbi:MAG TPA: hypothetical protein VHV75_11930 [Solirubrobacteraceae bacterium]|nr:hypothetical protein [Solirubrobacteraceae bacterium]
MIVDAFVALLRASGRFSVTGLAPADSNAAAIAIIGPDLVLFGVGEIQEYPLRMVEAVHELAPHIQTVIVADAQDPELIHCVLEFVEPSAAVLLLGVQSSSAQPQRG